MSDLNTSNINVPGIATMARHLADTDPHPQYLKSSDVLSVVNNTVGLNDLHDVSYGSGIASGYMLYYNGNTWVASSVQALAEEVVGQFAYATTTDAGLVKLAANNEVLDSVNSSSVVTPAGLSAWFASNSMINSGTLMPTLSGILYGHLDVKFPADIGQLKGVTIDAPASSGQVLTMYWYDSTTGSARWSNGDIPISKANTSTFGVVEVANENDICFGTSMTWEQMQISGHAVPSIAALNSYFGNQFVSAVHQTGTSTVVDNQSKIMSNATANAGSSILVFNRGIINSCATSGGNISIINGTALNTNVAGTSDHIGELHIGAYMTTSGIVYENAGGKAYNTTIGYKGSVTVNNGELCDVKLVGGATEGSDQFIPQSNVLTVDSNGHAHQVVIGDNLSPELESSMRTSHANTFTQGTVEVSAYGNIEHVVCNAGGELVINSRANVYHATIRGWKAHAIIHNGGYLEDVSLYTGGRIVVSAGGELNGMIVYGSADLEVKSGARVYGLVTLGPLNITSAEGAIIDRVGLVASDIKVYSSGSDDYNIKSDVEGLVLRFNAGNHPTGLRRVVTSNGSAYHTFFPVAVESRVPIDGSTNNYTMNISGLGVWEDVVSSTANWFITF